MLGFILNGNETLGYYCYRKMGSDYANEYWSIGKMKKKRDGNFSPVLLCFLGKLLCITFGTVILPPHHAANFTASICFCFLDFHGKSMFTAWVALFYVLQTSRLILLCHPFSYRLSSSSFSSSCLKPTSPWVQAWSCRPVHLTVHYNSNLALNHTGIISIHGSYPCVLSSWPTDSSTVWSMHMVCWHTIPTLYMST